MDTSTSLGDFPRQTRTQASMAAKPATTGARSVFDMAKAEQKEKRKRSHNPPDIAKVQMIEGPPPAKTAVFSRASIYAELYERLAVDKGVLLTISQAHSMGQWAKKFGKKVTVRRLPSHGPDVAGVWLVAD